MEQHTFHLADLENLPEGACFSIEKTRTWADVMQQMQHLSGIPADQQVFWVFRPLYAHGPLRPVQGFIPSVRSPHNESDQW